MTDRIAPNPHSPYANADPNVRHVFASPIFFPAPTPGVLAPAACDLMAVVPDELIETEPGAPLPDGLCADCVAVMQGGRPPKHPSSECGECGSATWHGELCALCRQEKHDEWWPTRDEAVIHASEIELDGGDLMLQELNIGDPIEIEKQTGPMHPGCWVITAFESEDRSRARVRRLTADEIQAARRGEAFARIYE